MKQLTTEYLLTAANCSCCYIASSVSCVIDIQAGSLKHWRSVGVSTGALDQGGPWLPGQYISVLQHRSDSAHQNRIE